jgi:tyrosine-protein phosphatase SIW14
VVEIFRAKTLALAPKPSILMSEIMTRFLLALYAALTLSVSFAGERGVPASCGITNFGRVNERVYRGAQPNEIGMASLKQLGIKSIINLRMTNDVVSAEQEQALQYSIVYTNVPLAGFGRPTDAQIQQVLSLIDTLPSPVYIHCQHGCDRTGTVIACYRMKHDGWSGDAALQEARLYGLSFFERGMRGYIADFAKSPKAETPLLSAKE